jgi:hypothetical protein
VNVAGALALAGGLFLVLFLAGQRSLWSRHLAVAVVLVHEYRERTVPDVPADGRVRCRVTRSGRVRRQGLEPRTRGLRVRCSAN